MPRYYFHVHDGRSIPDTEGTELPDLAAARQEAVRFAGSLLAHDIGKFWDGDDWCLEVTNAAGLIFFAFTFSAVAAPAATALDNVGSLKRGGRDGDGESKLS